MSESSLGESHTASSAATASSDRSVPRLVLQLCGLAGVVLLLWVALADVLWPSGGGLVRVLMLPGHHAPKTAYDYFLSGTFWPPTWLVLGLCWCMALFVSTGPTRPSSRDRRVVLVLGFVGLLPSVWATIAQARLSAFEVAAHWYFTFDPRSILSPGQSWLQVVRPVPWLACGLSAVVIVAAFRWHPMGVPGAETDVRSRPDGTVLPSERLVRRFAIVAAAATLAVLLVNTIHLRRFDPMATLGLTPLVGSLATQSSVLAYLFAAGWLLPVLVIVPLAGRLPRLAWAVTIGAGGYGVITLMQQLAYAMQSWSPMEVDRVRQHLVEGQIVVQTIALFLCGLLLAAGISQLTMWRESELAQAAEAERVTGSPPDSRRHGRPSSRLGTLIVASIIVLALVGIAAPRLVPSLRPRVIEAPPPTPVAIPSPSSSAMPAPGQTEGDLPTVVGAFPWHGASEPQSGWGEVAWVSVEPGESPVMPSRCTLSIDGRLRALSQPPTSYQLSASSQTIQFRLARPVHGGKVVRLTADIVTADGGHLWYSWSY